MSPPPLNTKKKFQHGKICCVISLCFFFFINAGLPSPYSIVDTNMWVLFSAHFLNPRERGGGDIKFDPHGVFSYSFCVKEIYGC